MPFRCSLYSLALLRGLPCKPCLQRSGRCGACLYASCAAALPGSVSVWYFPRSASVFVRFLRIVLTASMVRLREQGRRRQPTCRTWLGGRDAVQDDITLAKLRCPQISCRNGGRRRRVWTWRCGLCCWFDATVGFIGYHVVWFCGSCLSRSPFFVFCLLLANSYRSSAVLVLRCSLCLSPPPRTPHTATARTAPTATYCTALPHTLPSFLHYTAFGLFISSPLVPRWWVVPLHLFFSLY